MRLRARGIRHAYDAEPVLDGIEMEVVGGESLAVIGPSGVGKSTLLAVLGGLLAPDDGTVEVVGSDASVQPIGDAATEIGWVFQTTNAFGNRTARDNLESYLRLRGWPLGDVAARAQQVAAAVGIDAVADHRVRTLSGGERQRLGIARALSDRPLILLADEPTGQLDRVATRLVAELLVSEQNPDGVLVVVTHDPEVAARCDRQLALPL